MSSIQKIPSVAAILYNSNNQVLLQQRDNKPGLPFAGFWTLFGGLVEDDETPTTAVKRELIEEINLKPDLIHWKTYNRAHRSDMIIIQHVYTGRIDRTPESITLNEGQAMQFFNQNQLNSVNIAFGFDQLLAEFFANQ